MSVIGIDPTIDLAFKLMLGSPEHCRVTIHFLNAILGDDLTYCSQNQSFSKQWECWK